MVARTSSLLTWHNGHDVPKDGRPFIVKVKWYPWPLQAVWNSYSQCVTTPCLTGYKDSDGKYYTLFENKDHALQDILRWAQMPKMGDTI